MNKTSDVFINRSHKYPQLQQKDLFLLSNGIRKRKIFFNVEYTKEQHRLISEVRQRMRTQKGIQINSDQLLLRYLYSCDLKMDGCVQKLVNHNKWFEDDSIQVLTKNGLQILRAGFIYCDYKNLEGRGVVVMDVSDINLDRYSLNDYNQAINTVLNRLIEEWFIPGYVQTYDIILDTKGKLISLPITSLSTIITQLSDVYSMRLESMFVVNCNFAIKLLHRAISGFIAEETNRKIKLFSAEELSNGALHEFIDPKVLERKYGGESKDIEHRYLQMQDFQRGVSDINMSDTQYFSIFQDQDEFFNRPEGTSACCNQGRCTIY